MDKRLFADLKKSVMEMDAIIHGEDRCGAAGQRNRFGRRRIGVGRHAFAARAFGTNSATCACCGRVNQFHPSNNGMTLPAKP